MNFKQKGDLVYGDTRDDSGKGRRIIVRNFPIHAKVDDFFTFFDKETLDGITIIRPGNKPVYAFVQFKRPSDYTEALLRSQEMFMGGPLLICNFNNFNDKESKVSTKRELHRKALEAKEAQSTPHRPPGLRRSSPSPLRRRQRSPSPLKRRERSPSPFRASKRSPVQNLHRARSPAPTRGISRYPIRNRSRSRSRERSRARHSSRERSHAHGRSGERSQSRLSNRSRDRERSRSHSRTSARSLSIASEIYKRSQKSALDQSAPTQIVTPQIASPRTFNAFLLNDIPNKNDELLVRQTLALQRAQPKHQFATSPFQFQAIPTTPAIPSLNGNADSEVPKMIEDSSRDLPADVELIMQLIISHGTASHLSLFQLNILRQYLDKAGSHFVDPVTSQMPQPTNPVDQMRDDANGETAEDAEEKANERARELAKRLRVLNSAPKD